MGHENGHAPDDLDEEDLPLDPDEAAAGAATAADPVDESLDERVGAVIAELGGVDVRSDGASVSFAAGGAVFAVLSGDLLEVALDATVLKAALKTPDTAASVRGPGWIAFSPQAVDRFALDRAEAWVRFAHRRATGH